MLEDIKPGDRVINSLGEEATVVDVKVFNNRRFRLFLDSPITGWINGDRKTSWSYERDGKLGRGPNGIKASDVVRGVRHD